MAKPQRKGNRKGKFSKQLESEKSDKPDFRDAVLNASRFLKKKSGRNVDDNEEDDDLEFDDEELDSDAALGSDDDLDDYMVKKKNGKNGKNKVIKNDKKINQYGEDEDGWESVDEGELMTLSELWDRDDSELKSLNKKDNGIKNKDKDIVFDDNNDASEESESESGEESGEESESESESGSESESEEEDPFDEMKLSDDEDVQLGSVMKNLKSKLPKTDKDTSKKLLINDKTAENEFLLPTQGDSLTFDDMLEDIDENDGNNDNENNNNNQNESLIRDIAKHSKELKEKSKSNNFDDDEIINNNDENSAFAIPLPVNIQKRHERRAAYEIQKDQVNRWRDIIAHNRDQDVLKFIPEKPDLDKNNVFKDDNNILINELESKLDNIIDASNLESKETEDLFENIETAKLSKSEMMKRTNELRLMRELMYRGVKDSKRLKKIKSKAYRRQMRKEKLKEQSLISQANQINGIEDEDYEDNNDDPMYQRAKERMTLKHKNTSQWAKQMIKSGMSKDKSNRDELEEMMKQSERLKLKQLGRNENESSEDERDLSDLENDIEKFNDNIDNDKLSKVGKGVLAMDFMKNAEERDRLIRLKEIENLRKFENNEDYTDILSSNQDNINNGVNITFNNGRRIYTPSALVAAEEARKIESELLKELDEDDARLLKNRISVKERESKKRKHREDEDESENEDDDDNVDVRTSSSKPDEESEEVNPWLAEDDEDNFDSDEDNKSNKSNKVKVIDKSSSKLDKSSAKIAKKLSKRKESLIKQEDNLLNGNNEEISISNKETLKIIDPKKIKDNENVAAKSDDEYESDGNNEEDICMFKQSDLIQEAFAGDDILIEEFEQEKEEIIKDDGDKEVDISVPGWGSWAGADDEEDGGWTIPKNNKKRKIIKTIQGIVNKDNRLDKNKKNVIINERVNKKGSKYQADKVPYPYKTWEEYERSLRAPMGKEWTTTKTHQKIITPNVITKYGSVINPLKAPFTDK